MAEIDFYQEEDTDDGLDESEVDPDLDGGMPRLYADAELAPLQRLQEYLHADNIFNRSMLARGIMDTIRTVAETDHENLPRVWQAVATLGADIEPTVRADLMEQVPQITMYLMNCNMINEIRACIVPLFQRALTEPNNQVRKTSQAALLVLLEQEALDLRILEEDICPVIHELAAPESTDDFRTEAVALMSKMAPLIGREMTERVILAEFARMCSDGLFHVRKVCASNFGEMCTVVGEELTEEILLSKFFDLCDDGVWGVRKCCAECFMAVSLVCSQDTRRDRMAPNFVSLLADASRWVRMAAFQSLGPFISTFADPARTGMFFNEEGLLCYKEPPPQAPTNSPIQPPRTEAAQEEAKGDDSTTPASTAQPMELEEPSELEGSESLTPDEALEVSIEEKRAEAYKQEENPAEENPDSDASDSTIGGDSEEGGGQAEAEQPSLQELVQSVFDEGSEVASEAGSEASGGASVRTDDEGHVHIHLDSSQFNAFQYWRSPLPALELDLEMVDGKPRSIHVSARVSDVEHHKVYKSEMDVNVDEDKSGGAAGSTSSSLSATSRSEATVLVPSVGSGGEVRIHSTSFGSVEDSAAQSFKGLSLTAPFSSMTSRLSQYASISEASSPEYGGEDEPIPPQDVVPQDLLEEFLGMNDPQRAHTVDAEIVKHCAYSMPAVTYTLGRSNWRCVRRLFEKLSQSMQWKVRRCLASSLHELAVILGPEVTEQDIVPVFNTFLRDIDEVRIGMLMHLADYLRLLSAATRHDYLPRIQDFLLCLDNSRNWRFRQELVIQLCQLCDLYSATDINEHLVPLAIILALDRIAAVRNEAHRLLAVILRSLGESVDATLQARLLRDVVDRFAFAQKWVHRLGFVQTCQWCLVERSMSLEAFAGELLPPLLAFVAERIPNIRIALAKVVTREITPLTEFFSSPRNPHQDDLERVVYALKTDSDRDVRVVMGVPVEPLWGRMGEGDNDMALLEGQQSVELGEEEQRGEDQEDDDEEGLITPDAQDDEEEEQQRQEEETPTTEEVPHLEAEKKEGEADGKVEEPEEKPEGEKEEKVEESEGEKEEDASSTPQGGDEKEQSAN